MVDGTPLEKHLELAARHSPALRAKLAADPALPDECRHVWAWFCELNETRSFVSGVGGAPIPQALRYAELDSWARLTGRWPTPMEIQLLRACDRLWLAAPEDPDLSL